LSWNFFAYSVVGDEFGLVKIAAGIGLEQNLATKI
jgi:hypothetical protein